MSANAVGIRRWPAFCESSGLYDGSSMRSIRTSEASELSVTVAASNAFLELENVKRLGGSIQGFHMIIGSKGLVLLGKAQS